jgi:hypothetical protein
VNEFLASDESEVQKRRSTRITQAVPITVTGVDALGQPFKERTTTVMVNCHGCKYQSKHYVPKNSMVTLEVPRTTPGLPPRSVQGRVIWVQRPRTVRELFQIGLEFEVAGNIWGIAFPPEDWVAHPDDIGPELIAEPTVADEKLAAAEAAPQVSEPAPQAAAAPPAVAPPTASPARSSVHLSEGPPTFEIPLTPPAEAEASEAPAIPIAPVASAPAATEGKIHVVPTPAPAQSAPPPIVTPAAVTPAAVTPAAAPPTPGSSAAGPSTTALAQDAQVVVARHVAKAVAEAKETLDKTARRNAQAAINDEMTMVRQQLDAQLHDAVERAIKVSMERVSESAVRKVVQQAAERTAAIVEEARKASGADAGKLDAKIREAVESAVTGAAEQAARQAADQATAQNLKQTVEQAVERVIAEREATSPSLQILSSPEAAQAQLDQWKKNLEEVAQSTHTQTVDRAQADIAAAGQRWQQDFEGVVSTASGNIQQKVNEATQAALAQSEQDFAARSLDLRATLDETLAGAHGTVQSLTANLEQERARTEAAQKELQQASQVTLEQARQQLDEALVAQKAQLGSHADAVIAERTQYIEPILQNSAQKVLEAFTAELDQKLSPQLTETQKAIAELDNAAQRAAQVRATIEQQVREASQKTVAESVELLRQEAAKVPAEVEQTVRETLSKAEQDLEQKSSETKHETYEALLKASDWYTKKAHTTMQSVLEKAVEQSTGTLRDRAAEISSLAASELDHQRITYANHAQAQIEETAKEVIDRERGRLSENAEIASAGYANRVNQLTADSFKRFEESSRAALEKARSDMEFTREMSLTEYQTKLDERILQGIEQARTQLQSQLVPLMEEWDAERDSEKRMWMEQLKKNTDESIEGYKGRLENASNSWLLASAATLGQNSQAMLDTLAKAAEKRIRETCADVLSGMGDTIKERLIGLSTGFTPTEDPELPPSTPPKKKT